MTMNIWLIGAGPMAVEYTKVLKQLGHSVVSIGRSEASAAAFEHTTGISSFRGGLEKFLRNQPPAPDAAIIATSVESLFENCLLLLHYGIKNILAEKPGAATELELEELCTLARVRDARIYIGYNRRFYASVQHARKMIAEDGGVQTFQFEFTEWSHIIEKLSKADGIKQAWFLMNSTHVADMAFFLGGTPEKLECYSSGSLDWHPASSQFAGAGITNNGALFSYNANWQAPGRWGIEIQTAVRRYIFRPLEKLHVMEKGSIAVTELPIDDQFDVAFKPGLYQQVKAFTESRPSDLCSAEDQLKMWATYKSMAGYK